MRAVVYESFGSSLRVAQVADPAVPDDGVVIKVEASGICRSDWHGWLGHDPDITAFPHVPGHELAGTVAETGRNVSRWKQGDRVTLPFVCGCGTCPQCLSGNHQICDRQFQPGFTGWGSFAEYVAIRYADVNATLPESFQGRQMVCFKHNVDPIYFKTGQDPILDATGKFLDGNRRSEIMLMGVSYENYFPSKSDERYPYYVATNNLKHPLFANTGYRRGDVIGDVIGHEWDNTDPSPQKNRYWDKQNSHIPLLQKEKILVLFRGHPIAKSGHKGTAEAVYFESDAGGKVFSSGTIRWPWGLTKEGFQQEAFKQFNRNLIEVFLKDSSSKPSQHFIHK